jgi:hypothetical protein
MPSFVTHALFAEDSYEKAFGSTRPFPNKFMPWLILGAQGPDPLFSGIKRQPSGAEWGYRIHRGGFGRVASSLAGKARKMRQGNSIEAAAMTAYSLGFATHAVLDRAAHPYVNYFSGWVVPNSPESEIYRFTHPFLERIIDMIILADRKGLDIDTYDCNSRIPPIDEQLHLLPPLLTSALKVSYNNAVADETLEEKVANALKDDAEFSALISPSHSDGMTKAVEMEQKGELPQRVLGLFYPPEIPPGDFMNEDGSGWMDPRIGGEKRRESFFEIYESALGDAVIAMKSVIDADPFDCLGDGDLDDGSPRGNGWKFSLFKSVQSFTHHRWNV